MTAPLTPHEQQPPHQPRSLGAAASASSGPPQEPDLRAEVRQAAVAGIAITALGLALGLLWVWLAPHVPLVSDGEAVYLKESEGEQSVGAESTFVLLALAFGLLSAVAVFLWRRRGGVPLVIGLALGGLLGSVVAWRLGVWLGPSTDVVARAKTVGKGVSFDAPLELRAYGALLAWPIAALVVHLGLTALFGPRDPDPYALSPYGPDPQSPAPDGPPAA